MDIVNMSEGDLPTGEALEALHCEMTEGNTTADAVMEACEEALAKEPESVEVLYRCARAKYDQSRVHEKNAALCEQCLRDGLAYAERALAADDKHWGGHKWLALIQGTLSKYLPTREKILAGFRVKEHADIADRLKPGDATIKTCLGEWCLSVATISVVERTLASTIYATPPTATFAEAAEHFEAALAIKPYLHTMFMLGQVAKTDGKKDVAAKWYQMAIDAKATSAADEVDQQKSREGLTAVTKKGWFA